MSCGNGSATSPSGAWLRPPLRCAPTPAVIRSSTPPNWPCRPSVAGCSTSTPTAPASATSSPSWSRRPRQAWSPCTALAPTPPRCCSSPPAITPSGSPEAAFAHLCGVEPIHASSGKTIRHRLNRGGNRLANHALWRIVFTRMSSDPRTRAYVSTPHDRRAQHPRDHPRLKRYVAREVYRHLPAASAIDRSGGPDSRNARRQQGCPDNDLSGRHPPLATPRPHKSPPPKLEWPITGLPRRRNIDP